MNPSGCTGNQIDDSLHLVLEFLQPIRHNENIVLQMSDPPLSRLKITLVARKSHITG